MKKRTYQALQNRRNSRAMEGRVMGVGGNRAYGGTRVGFSPPSPKELPERELPLAGTDWEEYHRLPPRDEPPWKVVLELMLGLIGLAALVLAIALPHLWQLALVGAVAFVVLVVLASRQDMYAGH